MTRKRITGIALASFATLLALVWLFFSGSPSTGDRAAHDRVRGDRAGETHDRHSGTWGDVHGEPRLSRLLRDPSHQELPDDPLVRIESEEILYSGAFMAPRFAADGKHVLLTGQSYQGLWVGTIDGGDLRQISDGYMAGWRPVTTPEGDLIYRTATIDERGIVTGFTIAHYDLETGERKILYSGENEDVYPPWLSRDGDMLFIRRNGEVIGEPLTASAAEVPLAERDEGFAFSEGGQVWYHHVGLNQTMPLSSDPEATGGEVGSPDGTRFAYLSGNSDSMLIVDLTTGAEIDVGEGSNPVWSPDGRLIVYEVTGDDGHRILESQLFVIRADGTDRQRLTFDDDLILTNPSWSPDGRYIAAGTDGGDIRLFRVTVSTNQNNHQ